jgi:hypothetical protein
VIGQVLPHDANEMLWITHTFNIAADGKHRLRR